MINEKFDLLCEAANYINTLYEGDVIPLNKKPTKLQYSIDMKKFWQGINNRDIDEVDFVYALSIGTPIVKYYQKTHYSGLNTDLSRNILNTNYEEILLKAANELDMTKYVNKKSIKDWINNYITQ